MGGTRLWSLAVGASLALTGLESTGLAQLQPKADAAKATTRPRGANAAQDETKADAAAKGNTNRRPAFMDSPSARLQMLRRMIGVGGGGMGGPGGGRGGPGGPGGGPGGAGNTGPTTSG